jgi:hypothetical protein
VYFEIACKFYQKITVNKTQFPEMQSSFWKEVFRRYEDRRHNADQPILPPDELFIAPNNLLRFVITMQFFGKYVVSVL